MVKIKAGIVMTPREKAEFDRMNALPRKPSGKVEYYYKPQTKYPPRIYVFMHSEIWCDRNRRPMGLYNAMPFLTRPMNREEIEYHHFDIRLCYHQYEDWEKLIYAEEQEADELDKENPGTGTMFLAQLKSYGERYPIGTSQNQLTVAKPEQMESEETRYIRKLIQHGQEYTAKQVTELMRAEQGAGNRMSILILLRELYKNFEKSGKTQITPELIRRKVFLSQERTRKNFVRRVFKKNKLFALEEIHTRYPGYSEQQLTIDLKQKTSKFKAHKTKPVLDLRRCQLEKLAFKLKGTSDDGEYHHTCCKMVMLQNAHDYRLPIPLTVKLQGEVLVYSFHWKTRERTIKSFAELANTQGMTHESLKGKYQELLRFPQ
jgi:hypothetical protein